MVAGSALGVCPPGNPLVLWVKLPEGKCHSSEDERIKEAQMKTMKTVKVPNPAHGKPVSMVDCIRNYVC